MKKDEYPKNDKEFTDQNDIYPKNDKEYSIVKDDVKVIEDYQVDKDDFRKVIEG